MNFHVTVVGYYERQFGMMRNSSLQLGFGLDEKELVNSDSLKVQLVNVLNGVYLKNV